MWHSRTLASPSQQAAPCPTLRDRGLLFSGSPSSPHITLAASRRRGPLLVPVRNQRHDGSLLSGRRKVGARHAVPLDAAPSAPPGSGVPSSSRTPDPPAQTVAADAGAHGVGPRQTPPAPRSARWRHSEPRPCPPPPFQPKSSPSLPSVSIFFCPATSRLSTMNLETAVGTAEYAEDRREKLVQGEKCFHHVGKLLLSLRFFGVYRRSSAVNCSFQDCTQPADACRTDDGRMSASAGMPSLSWRLRIMARVRSRL